MLIVSNEFDLSELFYRVEKKECFTQQGTWEKLKINFFSKILDFRSNEEQCLDLSLETLKSNFKNKKLTCGDDDFTILFRDILCLKFRNKIPYNLQSYITHQPDFLSPKIYKSLKKINGALLDNLKYQDRQFVEDVVSWKGSLLQYVHSDLKSDVSIVSRAVRSSGNAFQFANDSFKKDKDFILKMLDEVEYQKGHKVFKYIDSPLKKEKEFILKAIKLRFDVFRVIDEDLKNDRKFVYEAIKVNGYIFEFVFHRFAKDKEIVLEAIKERGSLFRYADDSLQKEKEFVLQAIKSSSSAFEHADESLKGDRGFVLKAVQLNGYALQYVDVEFRKDREIVLAAVKQEGDALQYADELFRSDEEVVAEAVQQNGFAIKYYLSNKLSTIQFLVTLLLLEDELTKIRLLFGENRRNFLKTLETNLFPKNYDAILQYEQRIRQMEVWKIMQKSDVWKKGF